MHSTAKRRRIESWTRMAPKTSSSAIPTLTSVGPNGSPGNWRRQATIPFCKPGIFLRVGTSSSPWMLPLSRPYAPLRSSPRTISPPNSRPPNGRQHSDTIPKESRDCSYPYGCAPATWKDCWDKSSISTWWIRMSRRLGLPYCRA